MYVILEYDIKSDQGGAKVLSKTFKTCKKYLVHIQNSVFEGEISEAQLLKLKMELNKVIREYLNAEMRSGFLRSSGEWMMIRQVISCDCRPEIEENCWEIDKA